MVAKKNFAPFKRPFKSANQMLFNTSQIPENPGYMDFNNVDVIQEQNTNNAINHIANQAGSQNAKRKNQKAKQRNKQQVDFQNGGSWRKNMNHPSSQKVGNNNKFYQNPQQHGPMRGMNNGRIRMMANGGSRRQLVPPPPSHSFQRSPMIPPIPPQHMVPIRPPIPPPSSPFLRRNTRRIPGNGKPMFPGPLPPPLMTPMPMPPMMPAGPPMPRRPLPFNATTGNNGKIKKSNPKIVKKMVKNKSTIKTLKHMQNQFPLEKPWVTDNIRAEHQKKLDIENQLKGKKDDDLFAQFKTQRDKFVAMYETAREEYLKKEAAEVKTKDANGKQTNNKIANKSGKTSEKNPSTNGSKSA